MVTTTVSCVHHFVIGSPDGPTSEGHCTLCGEVRYFGNSLDACLKEAPGYGKNYHHTSKREMSEEVRQLLEWNDEWKEETNGR